MKFVRGRASSHVFSCGILGCISSAFCVEAFRENSWSKWRKNPGNVWDIYIWYIYAVTVYRCTVKSCFLFWFSFIRMPASSTTTWMRRTYSSARSYVRGRNWFRLVNFYCCSIFNSLRYILPLNLRRTWSQSGCNRWIDIETSANVFNSSWK